MIFTKLKNNVFILNEEYIGNCVDSFDQNGYSRGETSNIWSDVTEYAQDEESAKIISKEEFFDNIHDVPNLPLSTDIEYMYIKNKNVYIIYDINSDIHYFFKNF